jgi:hypothetical protein
MRMFKVKNKRIESRYISFIHTVYKVKENKYGDILFLTFIDGSWTWIRAEDYEPVE